MVGHRWLHRDGWTDRWLDRKFVEQTDGMTEMVRQTDG